MSVGPVSKNRKAHQKKECTSVKTTNRFTREDLANELRAYLNEVLLIVLDANQLNILNQVFRPILCAQVAEVTDEYVVLTKVNIKMSNAPEYIFPTELIIPLVNVVWFTPFDFNIRFSLY